MNRKKFFRNLVVGAVAIWKSPEILAEVSKKPLTFKTPQRTFHMYDQYRLAEAQLMRSYERAFLFGRDSIHWTEEEIRTLKRTAK